MNGFAGKKNGGDSQENPHAGNQDQGAWSKPSSPATTTAFFKGRGMNFEDVREYQPGDENSRDRLETWTRAVFGKRVREKNLPKEARN